MSRFEELQKLLAELGINVEAFSGNTLVFRSLPIWLNEVDETAFLEDLVERFENDNQLDLEHVRKESLSIFSLPQFDPIQPCLDPCGNE